MCYDFQCLLYTFYFERTPSNFEKTFSLAHVIFSSCLCTFCFSMSGHTRQGLKCRICKMNVHVDCQEKAPKCQTKARLLRRQKSTSEIETRVPESTAEEESEYCVLHDMCLLSCTNRCLLLIRNFGIFLVLNVIKWDDVFFTNKQEQTMFSDNNLYCFCKLAVMMPFTTRTRDEKASC